MGKRDNSGIFIAIIIFFVIGTIGTFIGNNWNVFKVVLIIIFIISLIVIITIGIIKSVKYLKKEQKESEEPEYVYNPDEIDYTHEEVLLQQQAKEKEYSQLEKNCVEKVYTKKKCLMTSCEEKYYEAIKRTLPENYICLPQVPLSAVIQKNDNSKYANELFRVLDFCIFSKNLEPLLIIEINDSSHNARERRERDKKVHQICQSADIPIITAWTSMGINDYFFTQKFNQYLNSTDKSDVA